MNGAFWLSGGRAALQGRVSDTLTPCLPEQAGWSGATDCESKDPEDLQV
jgi:hypothetical protein